MSSISKADKQKLLDRMRAKQNEQSGFRDPTEWRAPKLKGEEERNFRVIILPPLEKDDKCAGGTASETMDLYYRPHGHHFINKKRYECPRVHPEKGDCPLCTTGFDLMRETDDKKVRSSLAKEWLSQQNEAVNIYFENHKDNPEELRGKVLWWSLPQAIYLLCEKAFKSDDAGDDDNPQAHGLFFDPDEAFPLVINIKVKNDYNNYESSKFLGKARPIAASQKEIDEILEKRHDLMKKFDDRSIADLEKLLKDKLGETSGQDNSGGSDNGDDGYIKKEEAKKEDKKAEDKKAEDKPKNEDKKAEDKPKNEDKKAEDKPKNEDKKAEDKPKTEVKKEDVKKTDDKAEEEDPDLQALLKQLNEK
ncbi:MAG: hypothetical protein M0P71_13800 [Melioribacteraceae bacterium]|nr:hypothetical protein [Melioribacteraceae bacterium]